MQIFSVNEKRRKIAEMSNKVEGTEKANKNNKREKVD